MNPAALIIAEALVKYGPTVAREISAIFRTEAPTDEQWDRVFKLAEKPYESYINPTVPTPTQ